METKCYLLNGLFKVDKIELENNIYEMTHCIDLSARDIVSARNTKKNERSLFFENDCIRLNSYRVFEDMAKLTNIQDSLHYEQ